MGLIKTISNIELSNTKNSSTLSISKTYDKVLRDSGFMSMDIFKKSMELVIYFSKEGTQGDLSISGLGDSKLNIEYEEMLTYLKKVLSAYEIKLSEESNSYGIIINPVDWSANDNISSPKYNSGPCPWINNGLVMIGYNGDVHNCYMDAIGESVKLNIMKDDIYKYNVEKFSLCERCPHENE